VVAVAGIQQRKERVAEMLSKELPRQSQTSHRNFGCVQASQLWYVHMCIEKKEKRRAKDREKARKRERKTISLMSLLLLCKK